ADSPSQHQNEPDADPIQRAMEIEEADNEDEPSDDAATVAAKAASTGNVQILEPSNPTPDSNTLEAVDAAPGTQTTAEPVCDEEPKPSQPATTDSIADDDVSVKPSKRKRSGSGS